MIDELLKSKKVVVCVGTGGVGKTTTSAVLGFRAAKLGLKTLVITVDPSQRLASLLNIGREDSLPTEVPYEKLNSKLSGVVVNPSAIFDQFLSQSIEDQKEIDQLKKNRLYVQLKTRLSGSQEFTSLELLHRHVTSGEYDLVILDTPPAQNAIDFLEAPERLHALFDSSVTQWFLKTPAKQSFFRQVLSTGSEKVLSSLKKLTGDEFITELQEFFHLAQSWQEKLIDRMKDVQKILTNKDTLFLLVAGYDEVKLQEALKFERKIKKQGFPVEAFVVNQMLPEWLEEQNSFEDVELRKASEDMSKYYSERKKQIEDLERTHPQTPILHIPLVASEMTGFEDLASLAKILK